MISIKQTSGLLVASLIFASCAPFPPGNGRQAPIDPNRVPVAPSVEDPAAKADAERRAAAERKRVRDQKRRNAAAAAAKARDDSPTVNNNSGGGSTKPTPPKVTAPKPAGTSVRYAVKIPGKDGYVYNPWTNKAVDVRGLPKGTKVKDPNDPNPDHHFRVP